MYKFSQKLVLIVALILSFGVVKCQENTVKKFPSLFWEISGKGLKKPSYLFGTMHVSNKMVFHLSDSFYYAMKNVDAVALELNPDLWQGQMVRLDKLKQNYANFTKASGDDLITESSFRIDKYEDELKAALNTEPAVVNSLLYRTYKAKEDFEEDTFLDLYIFQTGKKLGKRSAGVENFYETEKIVLQAYADMATEKKKKVVDTDGESMGDINKKMQEAYRRGDLDLMDSLDNLTDRSDAFREKFLYLRNEIQANSIDTILKKSSLFVGVGAAHLPGPRGVIQLLRKMGYKLRPIKMGDTEATKKDETDQLKVPVNFTERQADDSFYKVDMPGPLFNLKDDYQQLDRRQYSDMSNGSYYLVTRVKTHAAFIGQSEDAVMRKIDSMLYENIPGKILQKKLIEKNGYKGYDISNKTRRGDLQRYNIFITPFEVLIFKMSGKEKYVAGEEASRFFSSIHFNKSSDTALVFSPKQGGFSINFINTPNQNLNDNNNDGIDRWEYEAIDKISGNAYLLLKKSIYNFKFLEKDSFDLKLIEESFRSADIFDKQLNRKLMVFNGYPCLDVKERMKDGSFVSARFIIKGPNYFVIAARSKAEKKDFSSYFNSFHFTPNNYASGKIYTDTFMHFAAVTPVLPELDDAYRAKLEKVSKEISGSKMYANYNSYWPKVRHAIFKSDSTGEAISVAIQQYPQYFYVKDSAKFWDNELNGYLEKNDLKINKKDFFSLNNGVKGYRFILGDTGSSRTINRVSILKDNYMFNLVTIGDTINNQSNFINSFYENFKPQQTKLGRNIFDNVLDVFIEDLFSKDSATHSKAQLAIGNVYYGEKGVPKIMDVLQKITPDDKDYFATKVKLIAELGYINDSLKPVVVDNLKKIYTQAGDTSIFQNVVIEALARHKTIGAIRLLKELILQDPPVFEKDYDYEALFSNLNDSLLLAATLYPEILQLTTLQDYKQPVISLLVKLVDSNYIKASQYESYFSKIYFDAKIALKKQQGKEEKKMADSKKKDDNDYTELSTIKNYNFNYINDKLGDYAVLLMPFYDKNVNVPKFFDKLLASKEEEISMNTTMLLLRNNKFVADSVLTRLAAKDLTRGALFTKLEKINKQDKFPVKYKTQLDFARSYLVESKNYAAIDSIVFVSKQIIFYNQKQGTLYFFKYRVKKEDDWKIGISGLQPLNNKQVSSNNKFCYMTDKRLRNDKPQNEQFQEQLKKILFSFHKSAKNFFEADGNNYHYKKDGDYED